jgi:hypothetical protein
MQPDHEVGCRIVTRTEHFIVAGHHIEVDDYSACAMLAVHGMLILLCQCIHGIVLAVALDKRHGVVIGWSLRILYVGSGINVGEFTQRADGGKPPECLLQLLRRIGGVAAE